jgi:hypothetical protein
LYLVCHMSVVPFPAIAAASGYASSAPPPPTMTRDERIWYADPRGFLRDDRLARFVPEANTSLDAQLNAIMRFALYLAVFVALFRRSLMPALSVLLTAAAVTYLVHRADADVDHATRERMHALDVQIDPATREICTRPTLDNPYMNVLMTDYARFPERPGACDITRRDVRDRADDLSSHDLYVDSDDIYGRRANSHHPFYTNATTTIPNDQGGFANWLYKPAPNGRGTCREGDGEACLAKVFWQYP